MPFPEEICENWVLLHHWILSHVMLVDSFKRPLMYKTEGLASEELLLRNNRKTVVQQRRLVEKHK